MYVGKRYEVTTATAQSSRFSCMHCNFECDAIVTGVGSGSGSSPYFLDNAGATGRANDEAVGAARENMHFALRAAVCPSCGKRDRRAVWHAYLLAMPRGLGLGLLVGVAIVAALQGSTTGWKLGIAGGVVLAAVLIVLDGQRRLTGALLQTGNTKSTTSRLGL